MLKPHELAAAQSFPKEYIFTGNRGEIVKQIGNAVCPKMAEALTANYMKELAVALV
jgi:DNA (cytosine-5)-methyltransferase 1